MPRNPCTADAMVVRSSCRPQARTSTTQQCESVTYSHGRRGILVLCDPPRMQKMVKQIKAAIARYLRVKNDFNTQLDPCARACPLISMTSGCGSSQPQTGCIQAKLEAQTTPGCTCTSMLVDEQCSFSGMSSQLKGTADMQPPQHSTSAVQFPREE
jgi:hypothetical protein